jgi:NAD(P)-dependent dehydrogenase (short-subunit alcohol dehydrogenase family)
MSDVKRILITGGVRRLGLAMALAFAERGARLALNYFHTQQEEAEQARQDVLAAGASQVDLIQGDLRYEAVQIVEQAVGALGGLEVLINNAGIFPPRRKFSGLPIHTFERTLGLNLLAPFQVTQAALPHLGSGSSVINLASLGGIQIWKERIDYNVSKSALITLTKALARDLADDGIRVNAIAPGAIQVDEDEQMGVPAERIPLGHYGAASDIAKAAVYLAFDAPYVTGQVIVVDGGRSLT